MVTVDVNRSTQFVSLDTHPANNALVVTYEILASVLDSSTGRELSRRSKRHQIQVQLSALDRLTKEDLEADKLALDLGQLSGEVISKCPLLAQSGRRPDLEEEIRLHLLYLIGRRRTQLLAPRTVGGASGSLSRPPSALASTRFSSAGGQRQQSARRAGSARRHSASTYAAPAIKDSTDKVDVYSHVLAEESAKDESSASDQALDGFLDELDEHLNSIEQVQNRPAPGAAQAALSELDSLLEGLYGDREEKLASVAGIRRILAQGDEKSLIGVASNRLLVCALLRTLRDSEAGDQHLSESILFCLLVLTTYRDIHVLAFATESRDPIELERPLSELLVDHIRGLKGLASEQTNGEPHLKCIDERHFYTNSLLQLLVNLFRLEGGSSRKLVLAIQQQLQQPQQQANQRNLVDALVDLLQLLSKHLTRCIRLMSKLDRTLTQLNNLICILRHLSIFKDFVFQLRTTQGLRLVDALVGLLGTLQLSRPGSGTSAGQQLQPVVTDKQTLKRLYLLELDLLRLVNNLVLDQRLRLKFVRRNLLKCVLRNVVVFLASSSSSNSSGTTTTNYQRQPTTIHPFQRSAVLMVPFRCLYELSCYEPIRCELYRSKIIIKCLLEFLLSATMDLKQSLEQRLNGGQLTSAVKGADTSRRRQQQANRPPASGSRAATRADDQLDQIVLEPDCAAHYIVSLWANLSSGREATIYGADPGLLALVGEFVQLALANVRTYLAATSRPSSNTSTPQLLRAIDGGAAAIEDEQLLMVYLHSKLLRNVSQYLRPEMGFPYGEWTQQMGASVLELAGLARDSPELRPLTIECLAALGNLLACDASPEGGSSSNSMGPLVAALFQADSCHLQGENDDLLLVSVVFLARVAGSRELCADQSLQSLGLARIIEASNFILDSKAPATDHELVGCCLYALGQLMQHSSFLRQLSEHLSESWQQQHKNNPLGQLVEKLAELLLEASPLVHSLAVQLLAHLRQLEQQLSMESLVYGRRFAAYHNKWLAAIRASGEDLDGDTDQLTAELANRKRSTWLPMSEEDFDEEEEDDFLADDPSQLRALETDSARSGSSQAARREQQSSAGSNIEEEEEGDLYGDSEPDDDDDESLNAPDLNVIDPNSMIKHLTSRREFRSRWLREDDDDQQQRRR